MHKLYRYSFIIIFLYLNFSVWPQDNNDEQLIISHLSKTYQHSKFNNTEYNRYLLNDALNNSSLNFYLFI